MRKSLIGQVKRWDDPDLLGGQAWLDLIDHFDFFLFLAGLKKLFPHWRNVENTGTPILDFLTGALNS